MQTYCANPPTPEETMWTRFIQWLIGVLINYKRMVALPIVVLEKERSDAAGRLFDANQALEAANAKVAEAVKWLTTYQNHYLISETDWITVLDTIDGLNSWASKSGELVKHHRQRNRVLRDTDTVRNYLRLCVGKTHVRDIRALIQKNN